MMHATAAARDASLADVPPLCSVSTILAALKTIEGAALPLAAEELASVAAATARNHASGAANDPALTPFMSTSVPEMRFSRYALHVAKATGYGHEGLAVGLALMGRYAVASGRGVTPLSMHRLFATAMQLGMKTASDKFVKNTYVAPLVGMSLPELNDLELALAKSLDYRALVTGAELSRLPEALAALPATEVSMAAVVAAFASVGRRSSPTDGGGLFSDDDDDEAMGGLCGMLPASAVPLTLGAAFPLSRFAAASGTSVNSVGDMTAVATMAAAAVAGGNRSTTSLDGAPELSASRLSAHMRGADAATAAMGRSTTTIMACP